ncbi:MAG: DUF3179 domain-containing protein [Nitrosopumilaceae archaeon]|nr:DUF3179 domain-containing protein [Nitrosopumilaceae archaeon]NIU00360.1 DUF3179 domain-containing protein [Nitrosopumilaceae archaeon]NIU86762.1 DUF3179 domain-containing protein [Nitrosopumilaceae archaeon]NIV65462.1 DUF3179 domain-containing protein [Nitrosopumilaceae archaeon]NIX60962.1 DUF3179 domain-containing protein [Nitrosopumilaceae archaeon]
MTINYLQFKKFSLPLLGILLVHLLAIPQASAESWTDNIFSWYKEGLTAHQEFVDAIQYLKSHGIISDSVDLRKKILDLEIGSHYKINESGDELFIVDPSKIRGGGPPKDGIPSIDNPKFAKPSEVDFLSDNSMVIGLKVNGDARAYPLSILVWHEIVNDNVGEMPVAVTYCPLCFTNQVFERTVNGQTVEFGTSGKLYNSNLVMYDRMTDSYWSQALGTAIKGELTGTVLKKVPFDVMRWADWKNQEPDTIVLTRDTGFLRSYSTDPYGSYYTEPRIMFPVENKDDRLPLKDLVVGFNHLGNYVAYPQQAVESKKVINDMVGGKNILVTSLHQDNVRIFDRNVAGKSLEFEYTDGRIIDKSTESEWSYEGEALSGPMKGITLKRLPIEPGFWFNWVAFHPNTAVYGLEKEAT